MVVINDTFYIFSNYIQSVENKDDGVTIMLNSSLKECIGANIRITKDVPVKIYLE